MIPLIIVRRLIGIAIRPDTPGGVPVTPGNPYVEAAKQLTDEQLQAISSLAADNQNLNDAGCPPLPPLRDLPHR